MNRTSGGTSGSSINNGHDTNDVTHHDSDDIATGSEATTSTSTAAAPTPPAAPTKPQLRRRLFEKLRTKRQQMILQHQNKTAMGGDHAVNTNDNNDDDNNSNSAIHNNGHANVTPANHNKKQSLVTHYYRVDTVPRKTLQLPRRHTKMHHSSEDEHSSSNNSHNKSHCHPMIDSTTTTNNALHSPPSSSSIHPHSKRRTPEKVVNVILPGVPSYEEDWARDTHDYFNLIILVPVTVLNIMNWNWDILLSSWSSSGPQHSHHHHHHHRHSSDDNLGFIEYYEQLFDSLQSAWTGDWFDVFFYFTAAYFIIDLLWIIILPICVKSPSTIIQHHLAVLLYIMIPYLHPNFRFCMGACMTVEINTWFLIARRVFNKQGFPPWTLIELNSWLSIRVKVISIFFYLTWISIRCILYPALMIPFCKFWRDHTKHTGTVFHLITAACLLHAAFCLLNLKWSYELLMSKVRYFRRQYILRKQQLRHDRNHPQQQQQRYQYQPDPSISEGL